MSKRPYVRGHKPPNFLLQRLLSSPISSLNNHSTKTLILTAKALKHRYDNSDAIDEREAIVTTIAYINNVVQARAAGKATAQNEQ